MESSVNIIGAGLAGCEAAWQLAERGVAVVLYDMKPHKFSPAHKNPDFAELVCSNSLRSSDFENNAVGLMQEELRRCNSLIISAADEAKVPAGGALAVDRDGFAKKVSEKIKSHPKITIKNQEITSLPPSDFGRTIIATGPLTSEALAQDILNKIDNQALSFYDAIAPVIHKESIDFSKAWYQSRYDKGNKTDYINCPMNKEQYYAFVEALKESVKADFHAFEKDGATTAGAASTAEAKYFDGCLPIEVMAERGVDTLAYGPMKPVGLTNPHSSEKPFAIVQLRQDNKEDTLRNMVGFQTKMKHGEQVRIFKTIPGLENAEFARLGGIHKNTFIKSPVLLDEFLRLKKMPHISFAGQITGCEGYVESAATGYLAGIFAAAEMMGKPPVLPPRTTAFGSMLAHLQDDTDIKNYQPMNINFGLFPAVEGKFRGSERKKMYSQRALNDLSVWSKKI